MNFDETSIRLKFLSKLTNHDKINVYNLSIVKPSWATSIYRFLMLENRNKTLKFVDETIDRAIELINLKPEYKESIITDLSKSTNGLQALIYSYSGDLLFESHIRTTIEKINRACKQS